MITALVHVTLLLGSWKRLTLESRFLKGDDVSKIGLNESHYPMLRLISQGKTSRTNIAGQVL